ncbi:glycosyltransferase [Nisaea nitritireducens]|uniref:glycosyltransferase n=1 Tax=Nisaea nitritireducens TaxID=568392 RepID=UPI0018681EB2|nr:glycosyltransferase [Nisaea nitritireducens]
MKRPLVMFGEDWGGLPSSSQHLAKRFAADRPVIWVNSIGLRRPRLNASDAGRVLRKLRSMGRSNQKPAAVPAAQDKPDNLTIIHPRAVSWPGNTLASAINRASLGAQIRAALKQQDLENPILWASLPTAVDVVGTLGEAAVAYYCCDDFSGLVGVDHMPVTRMEKKLAQQSDIVFVTNEALERKFEGSRISALPHGVDFDLFDRPADRPADLPDGKIALFYGSISDWLDQDLMARTAEARPDWTFVLIGKADISLDRLSSIANIRLLGPRPHHALPGYVQHADVALLPFLDTPQIRACNPLKLREYLASGTSVISTEFRSLAPYRDAVSVVADTADFSAALDRIDNSPAARAARKQLVASETWHARADQALSALEGIAA